MANGHYEVIMLVDWKDDEKSPPSADPKVAEAARKGWEEGTQTYAAEQSFLKKLTRLPCKIGLHTWKQGKDVLGSYGMGLESFETFTCRRCPAHGNRVKGTGNRFQVEGGSWVDRLLWP